MGQTLTLNFSIYYVMLKYNDVVASDDLNTSTAMREPLLKDCFNSEKILEFSRTIFVRPESNINRVT